MNVSSVKNLNGEVFSAVQDASLTNVVQTNSGIWQDITAYQNASATYLTAVDLTPYATTAEVDSISSMLSGAIDYVSANAGDEFPSSADEAITAYQNNSATYLTAHQAISAEEWNSNYETVTTNSGAWGGSALPISAGPGIKVNLVDNTLVFSNDETVLWSGDVSTTGITCNVTDSLSSYSTIKVYSRVKANSYDRSDCVKEITWPGDNVDHMYAYIPMDNIASNTHTEEVMYISATPNAFSLLAGWRLVGVTQTTGVTAYNFSINKLVGINRKQ